MLRNIGPMLVLITIALLVQCAPDSWAAEVYRCKSDDGDVTFSDTGCKTMIAETYRIVESSRGLTPVQEINVSEQDLQRLADIDHGRQASRNRRITDARKREMEQGHKDRACESARESQKYSRDYRRHGHNGRDNTRQKEDLRQQIRENCS